MRAALLQTDLALPRALRTDIDGRTSISLASPRDRPSLPSRGSAAPSAPPDRARPAARVPYRCRPSREPYIPTPYALRRPPLLRPVRAGPSRTALAPRPSPPARSSRCALSTSPTSPPATSLRTRPSAPCRHRRPSRAPPYRPLSLPHLA
ncbi:hypothetical protein CesoFtcFv8_019336 [Champsocephalus esox]|uniref:Uncharacterized protein n=1 Tax=Champsocephalus esox TaxID=159716 RepID=A0AAN8BI55_9TELE|nr:hypothetical protein CesoFtcFv8_019336 [Champsocephalus esox]